jgi:hypothetical protein
LLIDEINRAVASTTTVTYIAFPSKGVSFSVRESLLGEYLYFLSQILHPKNFINDINASMEIPGKDKVMDCPVNAGSQLDLPDRKPLINLAGCLEILKQN